MTLKNHITIIYFVLFSVITLRASNDVEQRMQDLPEAVILSQELQLENTTEDAQVLQLHRRQCDSKI